MKICILSRAFHPSIGGLERTAEVLATEFCKAGHRVEVVTDTVSAERESAGYTIIRTGSLIERVRAFKRADVVLFMNVSLHGVVAAWASGTPFVASHHSSYPTTGPRAFFLENAKRFLMRYMTNVACSHYVAAQIKVAAHVIPNALDERFGCNKYDQIRRRDFVFCGRLVSDKGADLCLRAFHKVRQDIPDATLTVIGEGPERAALEALSATLQNAGSVRFAGALGAQQVAAALSEHACMVVPSLWEEPFGIVALEGLACCDTIIVTRKGGLPEAVGECGVVVEPSSEDLALAMEAVARARRQGRSLPGEPSAKKRQEHLARHAPGAVAAQYLSVLRGAVAERVPGRELS
jgi:glycogen synthase